MLSRRQFVEVCAGAAGAAVLPTLAHAAGSAPSVHFPSNPRERVSVAAYPFREFIVGWKGWDGKTPSSVPRAQQIELKDFAAHVAEKFDVHKIEPWGRVFPSTDPKYLEQFRTAVEKAGSAVVDIAVDDEYSQYSPDSAERSRRDGQVVTHDVELRKPCLFREIRFAGMGHTDLTPINEENFSGLVFAHTNSLQRLTNLPRAAKQS